MSGLHGFQQAPGLLFAFGMGVLSFFSPCVLPLIPGYISFMSGVSLTELEAGGANKWQRLRPVALTSLAFIVGLAVVYMGLGLLGSLAAEAFRTGEGEWGRGFARIKPWLTRGGGLIVIVLGLHMTGLFRIKALYQEKRFQGGEGGTIPRAFMLGIAFAFGWAPCTGPVIGAIWTYAATSGNPAKAFLLMVLYTAGLSIPIFITGLATRQFFVVFDKVKHHFRKIEIGSGVLLVVVGLLMMFPALMNPVKDLLYWLLPRAAGMWG
jgi:cytochrome c-type biogenesis protein